MNALDDAREWPPVSVIMGVHNEERHLRTAIRHVLDQDYPGRIEVVVAVGPSRDRTEDVAADIEATEPQVKVVPNPCGTTPAALNAALSVCHHPVVARVDGHALLPPDYLRIAVETLDKTDADTVGGVMAAEGVTSLEQAIARAMTSRLGVGHAPNHTGGKAGPADTVYLGVFRRSALDRVGGYDETFLRAQDWEMNHRIRRSGGLIWFTPEMRVSYRPRSSLSALASQYFHYGRWRRVVARQHRGTVNLRYLAPPLAVVGMGAGLALGAFVRPSLILPAGYAATVIAGSIVTGRGLPARSWVLLPMVYATMHCSWGVGFLTSPKRLGRVSPPAEPAP